MRRILLLTAGLLAAFAAAAPAADNFTFVIMADRTGGADQPMFERAVAEIALLKPDFVVTVGDLIQGYAANDVRAPQWDSALAVMRRIPCPVYYAPGNHDIGDVESARLFFEKTDRPPYYSFDKGNSHFIVLNTALAESYGELDPHQKRWLERDLLSSQGRQHRFVFMHKTFWLAGAAADPATDPMHQLFKQYHVTAVFCGHGHSYVSQVIDGIRYAEIGATGANLRDNRNVGLGVFNQYAIARIRNGEFSYSVAEVGHLHGPELMTYADMLTWDRIAGSQVQAVATVREGRPAKRLTARLAIVNNNDRPLVDTLRWTVPANWRLKRTTLPLAIGPHDTLRADVEFRGDGRLYPLPSYRFSYPFGDGKHVDFDQPLAVARILPCPSASAVPLDAGFGEGAWAAATPLSAFSYYDGEPTRVERTEVRFLHDGANLFFAARCVDGKMDSLRVVTAKRDDPVHQDDCVGLLLSPDGKDLYQFYVNPAGNVWDQRIDPVSGRQDVSWNGNYAIRTGRDQDGWSVAMRIPLADLGVADPAALKQLAVNIRRKQQRLGSAFWIPEWNYTPQRFGRLELQ